MEVCKNFYPSNHAEDRKRYTEIVLTEQESGQLEVALFIILVRSVKTGMITATERKLLTSLHAKLS